MTAVLSYDVCTHCTIPICILTLTRGMPVQEWQSLLWVLERWTSSWHRDPTLCQRGQLRWWLERRPHGGASTYTCITPFVRVWESSIQRLMHAWTFTFFGSFATDPLFNKMQHTFMHFDLSQLRDRRCRGTKWIPHTYLATTAKLNIRGDLPLRGKIFDISVVPDRM